MFFSSTSLDDVASSEHVCNGCIVAVSRCLAFARDACVFRIAAEAVTPAVVIPWGWFGLISGGGDRTVGRGKILFDLDFLLAS